jgi:hypothetical protein
VAIPNGEPKLALPKLEDPGEEEDVEPNADLTNIDAGAACEGPEGVGADLAKMPVGTLGGTGESSLLLLLDCAAANVAPPPNRLPVVALEKRGESELLLLVACAAADVAPPPNRLPVGAFEKRGESELLLLLACAAADVAPPLNRLPAGAFEKRGGSTPLPPATDVTDVVAAGAPKPKPNAPGAFDGIGG